MDFYKIDEVRDEYLKKLNSLEKIQDGLEVKKVKMHFSNLVKKY